MMYFIGVVEILGAVGVVLEKTRTVSTYLIIVLMLGAVVTHFFAGEIEKSLFRIAL